MFNGWETKAIAPMPNRQPKRPIKMWTRGVPVEELAAAQLAQHRLAAVHLQPRRGDAGRAFRARAPPSAA